MAMISAGETVGASRWVQGFPLAMSAQVGTLPEGAQGQCELSCCVPARQLDWPTTPEGDAGGWAWGGVTYSTLARCDPSTPR
jgi:hypothetical protein